MSLHDTIKHWISETLSVTDDFGLEYPGDFLHGDFAVNIALIQAKKAGKNPRDLATEYVEKLRATLLPQIETVDSAGPGFINIKIKPEVFADATGKILTLGKHLTNHMPLSGRTTIVEYAQQNPFKEFHVGHMMNIIIGESVSRILEANGSEVIRCTYHGDVGLHVAKAIWGLLNIGTEVEIDAKVLGKAYATGAKLFKDDEEVKKEIIAINKKIYDKSDDQINTLYDKGFQVSLHYFEHMYERLGSVFNYHFYESQSAPIGMKLVEEFLVKGVFEKSEGAVIFPGEKYGLHTRVFISSEGLPLYEAKEVGLVQMKRDLFDPFELSITITANEQDAFFNVVEKANEQIAPEMNGKLLHLSHGILKLPSGKMSSRTGDVFSAEAMIDMVKAAALEKISERLLSEDEKESIAEMVALAALKFSILRQAIGGDIVFDIEKSLSFEGDSGPYLQYATVRAHTLLRKAEGLVTLVAGMPAGWQTTNLERLLQRYPGMVIRAGKEYSPHTIVTYLTELAGEFNSFYASHKIIDPSDPTSSYRLALTKAFSLTMFSGLYLLGISIPAEM